MGFCCCCCKRSKIERKTFSEQQTQTDDDIEENLIGDSNRESDVNIIKVSQELPSTEKGKEDTNQINVIENLPPEKKELMPYEIVLKDYLDEKIDDTEVFDKKWYSDLEKDKIIYSKRSIIAMENKVFDEKNEEYKEIYNKPPLFIAIKAGSFIIDQLQVTKNTYIINKNAFPKNTSIKMIAKYMLNTKERNSWDPQFKLYKVIEGSEEGKEVKCILHNWMKSPMFLVSERDIVEKRFDFFYEGKFYSYESSVNDDYIPLEENVTRINDIICVQSISEENDNIVFRAITQMDAKVSLPQAIINTTLSGKLSDFYKGIINGINKDYEEGNLVFEDNEGNIIENN
jgi:hypothetical protein